MTQGGSPVKVSRNSSLVVSPRYIAFGIVNNPEAVTLVVFLVSTATALLYKVFRIYEAVSFVRWLLGLLSSITCCCKRRGSA